MLILSFIDKIQYRIDSEFYTKEHLEFEIYLKEQGFSTLEQLGGKLDCSAFYPSITEYYNFDRQGIPFIRVNEIQNGLVQIVDSTAFLPDFVLTQNSNTIARAYPDDIIIAKGGNTLAKVGILTNEYPEYAICRDVILVRTKKMVSNMRYAVWAFLHSKYGYKLMLRTASQTGQPHLTLPNILKMMIPVWGEDMICKLCELYNQSNLYKDQSKALYDEAEKKMLEELELKEWKPTQKTVSIKNFSDFVTSSRLDAEYYQPKYDEIEAKIKSYKNGYVRIKDWFDVIGNPSPAQYTTEGVYVIKTKNIRVPSVDFDNITDCTTGNCLKIQKRDLLFASMGVGSLGRLSYIDKCVDNYTIDGTIKVFRPKNGNNMEIPTLLFLTSLYGKELIYRYVIGSTGIISISKENIENLIIPNFDHNVAADLSEKILESQRLKVESRRLLDLAKIAVERAIEKDEMEAMKLLN